MKTNTKIGQFNFNNCLMNASGIYCANAKELDELLASEAATFVTKTSTLEAREGNPRPQYAWDSIGTINSMGLPNLGVDYYLDYVIDKQDQMPDKAFFLSVTELTTEGIHEILHKVQASDYQSLTELNLSCPNVPGKPQVGYDFQLVDEILAEVFTYFTKPIGVKLPPYFDLAHFDQMAEILNKYPLTFINSINSVGNGLWVQDETVAIKPKNGFGGIGGGYIKATALANVHAFYLRLKPEIQIIGTGGVSNGRDAFEHILCGASMVQIGSSLPGEGTKIFARVSQELKDIMAEKSYESIEDFRGKLKYID